MQKSDEVRTMSVPEFSRNAQAVVDSIAASGQEIVLTREGRPVARLVACEPASVERQVPMDSDWSNAE